MTIYHVGQRVRIVRDNSGRKHFLGKEATIIENGHGGIGISRITLDVISLAWVLRVDGYPVEVSAESDELEPVLPPLAEADLEAQFREVFV